MNRLIHNGLSTIAWVWKHTAAFVALVAIAGALWLGFRLGSGQPSSDDHVGHNAHDHSAHSEDEPQVFTCSMHPSVRLDDPDAKCPICFMDLIPVETNNGGAGDEARLVLTAAAAETSRVQTELVERYYPTASVRLYGQVTYDQTTVARLTAYFPARIERLFVNFVGVPVQTGDHIAEVYSPELIAASEELRQVAQAAAAAGSAGELLRESNRDTLRAAREKLRLYGLNADQIRAIETSDAPQDQLTIHAPIGGIVTQLLVREGDYIKTGEPIATVADLSRLWLDLEAYESQLPMLRWGQEVHFTVEAHPGETFVGKIAFIEPSVDQRTRTTAVRVAVDNRDRRLKPGMFASAVVRPRVSESGALPGEDLEGKWISPMHPTVVKDAPGQCDVCGMDLVPAASLLNMSADESSSPPLVIPRSAVLFTGTRSLVYVQSPDAESPTYEGREVVLGPRAGDAYVVREGLSEGERVVVHGAFRIDSAMQIQAKPSMMMPSGGQSGAAHAGHGMPASASPTDPGMQDMVPEAFLASLGAVYDAYFGVQEALAADDFEGALAKLESLEDAVDGVELAGLDAGSRRFWRSTSPQLRPGSAFEDIESFRVQFEVVSDAAIALHRRFGNAGDEPSSIAHCPMAFDFAGADWLQRGTQINNPYFGASMLRCGDIQETFEPRPASQTREGARP